MTAIDTLTDTTRRRYDDVRQNILAAALAAGRPPDSVSLLAVSKGKGAREIRALYALGQRDFGENYVQELLTKADELKDLTDLRWHFIGHIQSNKLGTLSELAATIDAIDSFRHAKQLDQQLAKRGIQAPMGIFIAVNPEGEPGKNGCTLAEANPLAERIARECPRLRVEGLMAVPPRTYQDPASGLIQVPPLYRTLRALASTIGAGKLSLGMSGDLKLAIHAGSDIVRIGTALFGERAYQR